FTWTQAYINGGKPEAPLRKGAATKETGTTVTFWADPAVFESTTYSFETLSRRLQEMAFLNAGLSITLRDERDDVPSEVLYHYKGGLEDFVKHLNATKTAAHDSVIHFHSEDL